MRVSTLNTTKHKKYLCSVNSNNVDRTLASNKFDDIRDRSQTLVRGA